MDVSDVLRDRVGEPGGFERMAALSVLAHAVVLGILWLVPSDWFSPAPPPPKTVMTISLNGGNGGPNNGGFNSISQRAVQQETPPPPRPEAIRPPAAVTPEMTVPIPSKAPPKAPARTAKPAPPAPKVEQAPDDARGRTPTRGAEKREGNALAETGARGQGFGLSTSSGTGLGATLDVVGDFCCPEYIATMSQRIRTNWDPQAEVAGLVIVKYTIQRDGTITDGSVEKSSGYRALDINALRAVVGTRQLPPLPAAFTNQTLTIHLTFQYSR